MVCVVVVIPDDLLSGEPDGDVIAFDELFTVEFIVLWFCNFSLWESFSYSTPVLFRFRLNLRP